MRSSVLSVVVVSALVAAGLGGTFAGFVDTEISEGNFYQAGILDLLVNGKNDPMGAKLQYTHGKPCVSTDFWIDVYNWGVCQGGNLWMHIKDVVSTEAGRKDHMGRPYVYDGVSIVGGGIPDGYRVARVGEPMGAGVWSSEPEKIAEVGDGMVGQYYVGPTHPCLMGEDYASGIADRLDVLVQVCDDGRDGILDDADDNGDGEVDAVERARHTWVTVMSGRLANVACTKKYLGFLPTQQYGWIHVDVHLRRILCPDWPDTQTRYWPSNALQGDRATWSMMFELTTDPT